MKHAMQYVQLKNSRDLSVLFDASCQDLLNIVKRYRQARVIIEWDQGGEDQRLLVVGGDLSELIRGIAFGSREYGGWNADRRGHTK